MRKSNFALRLMPSLLADARALAKAEGVAVNQLINVAVAEKVAAARAERRLAETAAPPDRDAIVRLLRRHEDEIRARGVTRLSLVGSVARGDAGPASDVDVLVDIAPERKFSLIDLAGLQGFLDDMIGRETQVLVRDDLKPDFRRRVERDAVPVL